MGEKQNMAVSVRLLASGYVQVSRQTAGTNYMTQALFFTLNPHTALVGGSLLMPEGAGRARREWNAPRSHALRHTTCGGHRGWAGGGGRQRPCGNNKLNL